MADSPFKTALDFNAPLGERYDAQVTLTKSVVGSQLFPQPEVADAITAIQAMWAERDELLKAQGNSASNVILGPWGSKKKKGERGPQSIMLDDFQVTAVGQFWERPGVLGFGAMRAMVEQTPILNSIIMTRQRQVMRFCRPQMNGTGPGFAIQHVDPNVKMDDTAQQSIQLLQKFMLNSGWQFDPRKRTRMKRDNFTDFMAKSVRDTLTLDACPIETEWKNDRDLGIDGLYPVDGATIRLCTEEGFEGDDEIFAVQVIEGQIRAVYTHEDLIYRVRNPRTDVTACGYGLSETEMLIKIVTYMLNATTFNADYFDKNAIPRGFLNMFGSYSKEDLSAFRRYWNGMVRGAQNRFNLPVMVSKNQESAASWVPIGDQLDEMAFSKWLTFLSSIACAIYGTVPEEINMASFAESKSALSGSDTEEKLVSSNDKGLRPLLGFYEGLFSEFVIQPFSEDYMFVFKGLDEDDKQQTFETQKIVWTWNEGRAAIGLDPVEGPLGDMPLNAALIPTWQQESGVGMPEEDFGDPDAEGAGDPAQDGDEGDPEPEDDGYGTLPPDERAQQQAQEQSAAGGEPFGKSLDLAGFGMPVFRLDP